MTRKKDSESTEIPFRLYKAKKPGKRGRSKVWAKKMPEAFSVSSPAGTVNQTKSGSRHKVQYVRVEEGEAGDYLVILDPDTGHRSSFPGPAFEKFFEPADPQ